MTKTVLLLGVLLALGACSQAAEPAAQQVASARSSDAPPVSSSPSTPATPERVRERLDMTEQERTALRDPYRACMKDHGIDLSDRVNASKDREKVAEAAQACDPLLPLPAWETDSANPEALDFARRVVECLRAKGVKTAQVSTNAESGMVGPSFGSIDDQTEVGKGMELTPGCQREVANGGYK